MIHIGIDPGVKTGLAIIADNEYVDIGTMSITMALDKVRNYSKMPREYLTMHVENPNLRKWYGKNSDAKQQGAGSVKRDFKIWKDFAKENNINLVEVNPASVGSQFDSELIFKAATKWEGKTSIHARDAAKIIYKFYKG